MSNKQIKVTFRTLTPLWIGDAWGDNKEIRPSSIMGSLRFWFEVICYFTGVTSNKDYDDKGKLNDDLDEKSFKEKVLNNGLDFAGIDKALAECKISLPSRVFGCTGWKGWVRIKDIKPIEDYCFGNKLNLPFGLAVKKDFSEVKELKSIRELNKRDYSSWFFAKPYFYGKFETIFEMEKEILDPIFYPLLTFVEKYGFLGGKWNIGYGRVKIDIIELKEINWQKKSEWRTKKFGLNSFHKNGKDRFPTVSFYKINSNNINKEIVSVKECNNWDELENKKKNLICYYVEEIFCKTYKDMISELIKIKASHRRDISNNSERHEIFGEGGKNAKGTKIIPWSYEENDQIKGGFVSIAGFLRR